MSISCKELSKLYLMFLMIIQSMMFSFIPEKKNHFADLCHRLKTGNTAMSEYSCKLEFSTPVKVLEVILCFIIVKRVDIFFLGT